MMHVIRLSITAWLLYGAYQETGPFTWVILFFGIVYVELTTLANQIKNKINSERLRKQFDEAKAQPRFWDKVQEAAKL